jgi:glutaconate CoA-transferase subunit B
MIAAAALRLRDGEIVLVGVGAPGIAANLARRTHAPSLQLIYESGAIGSRPDVPPLSIGDPTLVAGAIACLSLADIFALVIEGRRIDTAFVGAAEIDRLGRLNSTVIGNYEHPSARLPGSGGACEIVRYARRTIVLAPLERRRFPSQLAFVTAGQAPDGAVVVVTDRAVLARSADEDELKLVSLFPGETIESVAAEVEWPLAVADNLAREDPMRDIQGLVGSDDG